MDAISQLSTMGISLYLTKFYFAMGFWGNLWIVYIQIHTWVICAAYPGGLSAKPAEKALPFSPGNTQSPQPSYFAAGGLLLVRFFQFTVTCFLCFALGICLNCHARRFFKPRTSPIDSSQNRTTRDLRFHAYSSLFGTNQVTHFTLHSQ